jgi:hypothetical protein
VLVLVHEMERALTPPLLREGSRLAAVLDERLVTPSASLFADVHEHVARARRRAR